MQILITMVRASLFLIFILATSWYVSGQTQVFQYYKGDLDLARLLMENLGLGRLHSKKRKDREKEQKC